MAEINVKTLILLAELDDGKIYQVLIGSNSLEINLEEYFNQRGMKLNEKPIESIQIETEETINENPD